MNQFLWVGIGGFIGAVLRYGLGGFILHRTMAWKFPVGTFVVNVIGCLAAGFLAGLVEKHDLFNPQMRLFLFTGFLGGFTTFSAFGLETMYLFQRHEPAWAFLNIVSSVVVGLGALWLGLRIIQ